MTKVYKVKRVPMGWIVFNTATQENVGTYWATKVEALNLARGLNEDHEQCQQEEAEEVREMVWVETGGPERETQKHRDLSATSMVELTEADWTILQAQMIRAPFEYLTLREIVVRKNSTIHILRWSAFNRFWMRDTGHGWTAISRRELGLAE